MLEIEKTLYKKERNVIFFIICIVPGSSNWQDMGLWLPESWFESTPRNQKKMEEWPRGRRRSPAKRVHGLKTRAAGSNPASSEELIYIAGVAQ